MFHTCKTGSPKRTARFFSLLLLAHCAEAHVILPNKEKPFFHHVV